AIAEEREPKRPQKGENIHQKQERQRRRHQKTAGIAAPGVDDHGRGKERSENRRRPEGDLWWQKRDRDRHGDDEHDQSAPPVVPARRDQSLKKRGRLRNV